jgi:two-component system response regulator FixJ
MEDCKNSMEEIPATMTERSTVLVVDDDSRFLRALGRLVRSIGFDAHIFERPKQLLDYPIPKNNTCLLLDVDMPEMNGVELYEMLAIAGRAPPLIMMTGRDDLHTRQLLRRTKAVAVLSKPFDQTLLLQAISRALASNRSREGQN